jgi:hypothetical protein
MPRRALCPAAAADVLKGKGVVATALLCRGGPTLLCALCSQGVLQRVEKAGREQSQFIAAALGALRAELAAAFPALLSQVRSWRVLLLDPCPQSQSLWGGFGRAFAGLQVHADISSSSHSNKYLYGPSGSVWVGLGRSGSVWVGS